MNFDDMMEYKMEIGSVSKFGDRHEMVLVVSGVRWIMLLGEVLV